MVQQTVDGEVRVTTGGSAWLDRDFVVLMQGLEAQSLAVAGPDPASGEGHCALIADGRVHEHQHCVLNPAKYVERFAVEPAPLGRQR